MLDMRDETIEGLDRTWFEPGPVEIDADALDGAPHEALGFDGLPAGVFLAAGFAGLDFDRLPGDQRVEAVAALQRLVSHYQAKLYEGVASIYGYLEADLDGDVELAQGATAAEVRAQLRLTCRSADTTVELALILVSRLPALHDAFLAGKVDVARVRTLVQGTEHLDDQAAQRVIDQILPKAPRLTTGQLAALLRRLCLETDPDDAANRYETAREGRRVEHQPTPEGTGHIVGLHLDPIRSSQAMSRIDQLARSLRVHGETRTMDQLRADVFLDLLCGDDARTPTATSHITVDLGTLMGLADRAGELGGFGPVVADLARRAAAGSRRWEYSIRDGDTGDVIDVGTTRRRPTAALGRAVQARQSTCVFPGCRMPAIECDFDHIDEYAKGGPTSADNLAPACRHDHLIKHRYGWTYRRRPDGTIEWTSRLGLQHVTLPP